MIPGTWLDFFRPVSVLGDRRVLAVNVGDHPPTPEWRDTVAHVLSDLNAERMDTIGLWSGRETVRLRRGVLARVGFSPSLAYDGRGEYVLLGSTDSLDLTLFSGVAPVLKLRGTSSPVAATEEEKQVWRERWLSPVPQPDRARYRELLEDTPIRESFPAFGAAVVDAQGRIWVGEFARPLATLRRWWLFGSDGEPLGYLELPIYFSWPYAESIPFQAEQELLDVGTDRIAVLRKNEFDEEYVEIWKIEIPRR
jgi:hypothetical protein